MYRLHRRRKSLATWRVELLLHLLFRALAEFPWSASVRKSA